MHKKKKYKAKKIQNSIANNRIKQLFLIAEKNALVGDLSHANRYIEIARAISMRNRIQIPKEFKRRFCKHCYNYLLPSVNCRVRIYRGKLIIYCKNCNKYTRIIIKKTDQASARLK
jgi:ribonuclease P protein subunit RPR2